MAAQKVQLPRESGLAKGQQYPRSSVTFVSLWFAKLWGVSRQQAIPNAEKLIEVWLPFLCRNSPNIVQGPADEYEVIHSPRHATCEWPPTTKRTGGGVHIPSLPVLTPRCG